MSFYKFKKDMRSLRWLPNLVTLFNLFTGFLSIVLVSEGKSEAAAWLVFVALFWDSLDGNIARIFQNPSLLGKELDSLADMVSFGVAPAFIFFKNLQHEFSFWTFLIVFIYLGAVAYRLARFNIKASSAKTYFQGLPSPAAAVTVSMVFLAASKNGWMPDFLFELALMGMMVVLAFLMVSSVPYPKVSMIKFEKWQSLFYLETAIFILIRSSHDFVSAVTAVFITFILISPAYAVPLKTEKLTPGFSAKS